LGVAVTPERAENGEGVSMHRVPVEASRRLRWGCLTLAAVVALLAVASDPADARSRRKRHHAKRPHAVESYNPPYAAIVVDAKTGVVLHEANPDSPRHPASLTKMMTLYLLFEQLEAGKIKLDTPMEVSQAASEQAPTKLGLKPGQTIEVEDAIKGLVTKSANDAAVVVAEALGGSERSFAQMMTRKARALGMAHTFYHNASGLPDDAQITTARDQALLGIAIQERFPRYYRYFSTQRFVFRGNAMTNHNHLLGRIDGVDGIKTGYIRASGFNIVTSVRRGGRHIVAVVIGGRSSAQRDARMRELISTQIARASTKPATTIVAEAPAPEPEVALLPAALSRLASVASTPVTLMSPRASEATATIPTAPAGSSAPIKPVPVKTVAVKLVSPKQMPTQPPVQTADPAPAAMTAPAQAAVSSNSAKAATPSSQPPGARPGILGVLPAVVTAAKNAAVPTAKADEAPAPARHTRRGGWAIQIGAYEDEGEAKERLNSAQSKASRLLEKADAYTERTTKGDKIYYRARFAGFDRNRAHAVCRQLKRSEISCMALKI
jgi:D-alanyl-D-alanine carboxypeptidase